MSATTTQRKTNKLLTLQNFKIGLFISLLGQPFEVIRTSSIMSIKNKNKGFTGMFNVIKQIFELEGLRGFFRGGLLSVGKSTLSAGLFLTGLENVHILTTDLRTIKYIPGNMVDFLNACVSKTLTTFVTNPIVVVKTRFEIVGNNQYKSIRDAVWSIYKKEGMRGFYTGIPATLFRDVPYAGIQYSVYKWTMDLYSKYALGGKSAYESSMLVSTFGGISALYAVLLTYPFDNLRVRLQCHDLASIANVDLGGLRSMVQRVYLEEGIRGFYVGFLPRLLKKVTSSAIIWALYEKIRRDSVIHDKAGSGEKSELL